MKKGGHDVENSPVRVTVIDGIGAFRLLELPSDLSIGRKADPRSARETLTDPDPALKLTNLAAALLFPFRLTESSSIPNGKLAAC
ncbi:MAG TPA: hypothetical protein VGA63_01890 [Geopsychrobacteraceae bacterium]